MAVTPTIQNVKPVVGGSADTWGGTINSRIGETYTDINALAVQSNAAETAVGGKVNRTGDTMTGDLALANAGPAGQYSAGFRGAPVISTDQDRTLALTDSGKMIRLFGTTARTWTVPNASTVGFLPGTTIVLRNYGLGVVLSVAKAAGVELRIPGSSTNAARTIAPYGMATLVCEDTNLWILSGPGAA